MTFKHAHHRYVDVELLSTARVIETVDVEYTHFPSNPRMENFQFLLFSNLIRGQTKKEREKLTFVHLSRQ